MEGAPEARQEQQFGIGKSVLFSLILIAVTLGAIEASLRIWVFFFRDAYERFNVATGTFELVPGEYSGGIRVNGDGFVGEEFLPGAEGRFRIYTLGDSCTFGGGNQRDTYPGLLDRALDRREGPGREFEVVNAGIQGLNSELALNRLRYKGPEIGPEIVTIYIGWNDLMKFDPDAQGEAGRWADVARLLDRLWIVKGMRKLLFFHVRPQVSPPRTGPESRTGRFHDFQPRTFEADLRQIVDESREQGAQPVLLTLPTVVREDMSAADIRQARVMFPYFPGGNSVGDFLDLLDAYNRTIRRVAVEQRVPLVDLSATFAALSDVRPYFYDTMHPTDAGRRMIAEEILKGFDEAGLLAHSEMTEPTAASARAGQPAPAASQ